MQEKRRFERLDFQTWHFFRAHVMWQWDSVDFKDQDKTGKTINVRREAELQYHLQRQQKTPSQGRHMTVKFL